jgi:hypothetical protein
LRVREAAPHRRLPVNLLGWLGTGQVLSLLAAVYVVGVIVRNHFDQ